MQLTVDAIQAQIPYYLTQDAKENLIKAFNDFPKNINYYTNLYLNDMLQGDGWSSLELFNFENGEKKETKGILLSNSCDIDIANKRDFPPKAIFAPIVSFSNYCNLLKGSSLKKHQIDAKLDSIRSQQVTNLFYLPKGGGLDDEYIAILDDLHTMPVLRLQNKATKQKIFTLSQIGFYIFLFKISVHLCRFHENIAR